MKNTSKLKGDYGHWVTSDFNPDDYFGFIYLITNNINNKSYVGRKQFQSLRRLKPLKGRKNKRHVYKTSNWRSYTSSSAGVNSDITKLGISNFTFSILRLCKNKSQLAYYEAFYMFEYDVLTACDSSGRLFYNQQIPAVPCPPKF